MEPGRSFAASGAPYRPDDEDEVPVRVAVVVNKAWEADPLVDALSAAPSAVGEAYRPRPDSVRFVRVNGTRGLRGLVASETAQVDVWCIEELLPDGANKSSSQEKAAVLLPLLAEPKIRFVIAFGTAASSPNLAGSQNGCVAVGRRVFVHDAHPPMSTSHWPPPAPDAVLESTLSPGDFASLVSDAAYKASVEARMLAAPLHPADAPALLADADHVALADVNVTDPKDYGWADKATFDAYAASGSPYAVGSLETTHGIIRSCMPQGVPFMFVSGIVNRAYKFLDDVLPRPYAQNFAGAHNAGVAVAFMLPAIFAHARSGFE